MYQAVKDSEGRITALIQSSVGPLSKASEDHERRLRTIEERGPSVSISNSREISALKARVDIIEDGLHSIISREQGIFGTVRVIRLVVASVLSTGIAFAAILSALSALNIIH